MAEAAVGLAIGAVSLAALFTTCVDCFEYVQLGRQFGTDYQRSVLKLDIVKLRLSRWANAVNESQNHYSVPVGSDQEARQVEQILGEIISVFAAAEEVSQRYKSKAQPGDLVVYNADSDLEKDLVSMHNKMRDLALKRQKRSTFRQKAGWALYDKSASTVLSKMSQAWWIRLSSSSQPCTSNRNSSLLKMRRPWK